MATVAVEHRWVELSHGKTRYWEAGTGYPTILLHGAGWVSGCENWALAMGPLSEKLHVFAIDCLNWGTGDIFNQEMSFAYLVDHVVKRDQTIAAGVRNQAGLPAGAVKPIGAEVPVAEVVRVARGKVETVLLGARLVARAVRVHRERRTRSPLDPGERALAETQQGEPLQPAPIPLEEAVKAHSV